MYRYFYYVSRYFYLDFILCILFYLFCSVAVVFVYIKKQGQPTGPSPRPSQRSSSTQPQPPKPSEAVRPHRSPEPHPTRARNPTRCPRSATDHGPRTYLLPPVGPTHSARTGRAEPGSTCAPCPPRAPPSRRVQAEDPGQPRIPSSVISVAARSG